MKSDQKALVFAMLAVGAAYFLLSRSASAAGLPGGNVAGLPTSRPIVPYTPGPPSAAGGATGLGTNIAQLLTGITGALGKVFTGGATKGPGNTPGVIGPPTSTAVPVIPYTLGAGQPNPGALIPPPPVSAPTTLAPLPNLADPNMNQYWGLLLPSVQIDAPSGTGGVPSLSSTLDPNTLGFDPNFIAPPPDLVTGPAQGGISIVGLE